MATCSILLLDGSTKDMRIQGTLTGQELFDLVTSQFGLHEKEFFGLEYRDEATGLSAWLDMKAKVIDQLPKGGTGLTFSVQHYIPDCSDLKELTTQRLFFLQTVRNVANGRIACASEQAVTLAALALQALEGDFVSQSVTRVHIDDRKLIPDGVLLAEGWTLEGCASKVSQQYETLIGMDAPSAMLGFMTIAQRLPQYGVQYFEAKDKKGMPWLLGVGFSGLSQYYFSDNSTPRQTFEWSRIINVSCSKTKFLLELHVDETESSTPTPSGRSQLRSSSSASKPATTEPSRDRTRSFMQRISVRGGSSAAKNAKVWYTSSPAFSSIMLNSVIKQHAFNLKYARSERRFSSVGHASPAVKRRVEGMVSSPIIGMAAGTPSAKQVNMPESATHVKELLRASESSSNTPLAASRVVSAAAAPVVRTDQRDDSHLEKYLRRKKQLVAELRRKRKLLAKLQTLEKEFLQSVRDREASSVPDGKPEAPPRSSSLSHADRPVIKVPPTPPIRSTSLHPGSAEGVDRLSSSAPRRSASDGDLFRTAVASGSGVSLLSSVSKTLTNSVASIGSVESINSGTSAEVEFLSDEEESLPSVLSNRSSLSSIPAALTAEEVMAVLPPVTSVGTPAPSGVRSARDTLDESPRPPPPQGPLPPPPAQTLAESGSPIVSDEGGEVTSALPRSDWNPPVKPAQTPAALRPSSHPVSPVVMDAPSVLLARVQDAGRTPGKGLGAPIAEPTSSLAGDEQLSVV